MSAFPASPPRHVVSVTRRLNTSPRRAYETIANYHTGHPRIVPDEFRNLVVEQGGIGAGTIIRFDLRLFGRTTQLRAAVTEPQPGRVLVEKNIEGNDAISTFTVDPGDRTDESVVTIRTDIGTRRGLAGRIERWLLTRILERLYHEELRRLEIYSRAPQGAQPSDVAT